MNWFSTRLLMGVIVTAVLNLSGFALGKGTLVDTSFFSILLDTTRFVDIYLPEGYDNDDVTRYPVVYYLHGYGQDQNDYPFITDSLDVLIANKKIEPVILVKPDGSVDPFQDWDPKSSWYANSELNGRFEDYIIYDLVDYIDSNFRTMATRDKRCIMGLSMGGNGAMHLALKHLDIYGALASLSGTLDFSWCNNILINYAKRVDYNNTPPYNLSPKAGVASLEIFSRSAAYSPNLQNPPYFVDLVIDSLGNIVDSVWAKWMSYDPKTLASTLSPDESNLHIYFDCGQKDQLGMFQYNVNFANRLDSLDLNYVFHQFDGGHTDLLNTRIPNAIAFFDSVMWNKTTGIENKEESLVKPSTITVYQNYPNPFNPSTTISYALAKDSHVKLTVYNTLGQVVAVLIDGYQTTGSYNVKWDAHNQPSGIYLYKLKADGFSAVRKMFLQK